MLRMATLRCQYLSCFKDSGEDHFVLKLFHENIAHTSTYATFIYFQRIFVEQNCSYKFTWWLIINNRNSKDPLEWIINKWVLNTTLVTVQNLSLCYALLTGYSGICGVRFWNSPPVSLASYRQAVNPSVNATSFVALRTMCNEVLTNSFIQLFIILFLFWKHLIRQGSDSAQILNSGRSDTLYIWP
jgi:hypothetical protein